MNLTPTQLRVLRFIQDYRDENGCTPTMQEIGDALGQVQRAIDEIDAGAYAEARAVLAAALENGT